MRQTGAMRKRTVTANDKFQRGYRYTVTAPAGRQFDPEFKPELTPPRCWRSACSAVFT
jgi:hypothetical protein